MARDYRIPSNITPEHIIQAINEIKIRRWPDKNNSIKYDLLYEGVRYPPKIVVMYANKYANGELFDVSKFTGGEDTTNKFFRARGFEIVPKIKDESLIQNSQTSDNLILEKYHEYTRKDVHEIFDKNSPFTLKSGTWGIRGIISHPSNLDDFIFFVTFGRSDLGFTFEESVTESGILTWQSEPKQKLNDPTIQRLIHHDYRKNSIHLFLKHGRDQNLVISGTWLTSVTIMSTKKQLFFKWQILDWDLDETQANSMGLELIPDKPSGNRKASSQIIPLIETQPPEQRYPHPISGEKSRDFVANIVNFAENETKRKEIGATGEDLVLDNEKKGLEKAGYPHFIRMIEHVSKIQGDGAGYDIRSVTPNREPKYIEVKTTVGGKNTPFSLSINEVNFSHQHQDNYYLYRIYDFDKKTKSGKCYILTGDITKKMVLEPTQFNCRPQIKRSETDYSSLNDS